MAIVSAPPIKRSQLASDVLKAIRELNKREVVNVTYRLDKDATEEPSIYFRIVLTNAASKEDVLADVARRIEDTLFDSIRPLENWGLIPYFNFHSAAEQQEQNHPEQP